MRRISLWVLSTISTLVLLFGYSTSTSGPQTSAPSSVYSSSSTPGAGNSGTSSSNASGSGPGSGSGSASTSAPNARTYTGSVAQTQWGPVQLQLRVSNSKITKVSVVQYPSGNGQDQQINSYAIPVLNQEAVRAGNANIDMVSGATFTSEGYLQSLQSALDKI